MAFDVTRSPKRSVDSIELAPGSWSEAKRRRCMPLRTAVNTPTKESVHSPFVDAVPKLTSDEIAARLTTQTRQCLQLKHRSPVHSPSTTATLNASPSISTIDDLANLSPSFHLQSASSAAAAAANPSRHRDVPMLTLKQVGLVCERMLREREEQLRDEYEKALACRLSEQYEAFLKFNHDQLYRRAGEEAASYVS